MPTPVSVLVMSYNHERFVERCLDSIVAADWSSIEIVVVDDGSTDESPRRIRAWLDVHPNVRCRLFLHTDNKGLCARLNEGVVAASGDVVMLLAADDEMLPGGIVPRVRYLELHPEKLAVFSDAEVIDIDGKVVFDSGIEGLYARLGARRDVFADDQLLRDAVVFTWGVPGATFAWRRGGLEKAGWYDTTLGVEDWEMYLRLASRGHLGFVDACVGRYRVHDASFSVTRRRALEHDLAVVAARYRTQFRGLAGLRLAAQAWRAPVRGRGRAATALARAGSRLACRLLLALHLTMRTFALRRRGRGDVDATNALAEVPAR